MPGTHITSHAQWQVPIILGLGRQRQEDPGTHRPASQDESVSFRFNERSLSQTNKVERSWGRYLTLSSSLHTYAHTCSCPTHTLTCIATHTAVRHTTPLCGKLGKHWWPCCVFRSSSCPSFPLLLRGLGFCPNAQHWKLVSLYQLPLSILGTPP